jgi:cobalamin biosynthesis protein CobT
MAGLIASPFTPNTSHKQEKHMSAKIKGTSLKEEMKGVTRTLGRKSEIQVAFAGREARVDGDVVVLPDIEGAEIDQRDASVMRGFVDHHSGVAKYSDTHLIKAVNEKSSNIGMIMQSIEDPRIDAQRVADYVGSRQHISDAVDAMCDAFRESQKGVDFSDEDVDWRNYVPMAIATQGRKDTGLVSDLDSVKTSLPDESLDTFNKFSTNIKACKSTLDSLKVAVKIAKDIGLDIPEDIKNMADDGQPIPGSGEGGDADAEAYGDIDKPYDGDMIAPDMAAAINFEPDDSVIKEYKEFFEQDVHIPFNTGMRKGAKWFESSEVGKRLTYIGRGTDHDYGSYENRAMERLTRGMDHTAAVHVANSLLHQAGPVVGQTRTKLESMLFAQLDRTWEGAKLDGRLDQKRLAMAAQGMPQVFKHRASVNEIDAAVQILVDLSGSMGGSKEQMAALCTLAISESLNKLKVPFSVWGFNTLYDLKVKGVGDIPADIRASVDPSMIAKMIGGCISTQMYEGKRMGMRLKPTTLYHYKDFNDSYLETRPAIAMISQHAGGDNHDAAAVYHSYMNLRRRTEKRRLLIILSDGQPSCGAISAASQLSKLVPRIEADKSINTLAIGIQSDAPRHYYKNSTVVNELNQLPTVALKELSAMLR